MRVQTNPEHIGDCGCGRAPNGKCNGWHGLTQEAYEMELELWRQSEGEVQSLNPSFTDPATKSAKNT